MLFIGRLNQCVADGQLPEHIGQTLKRFYGSYVQAIEDNGHHIDEYLPTLNTFLDLVLENIRLPRKFEVYHQGLHKPFDYYHFGLDLLRPLIIFERSEVLHIERVEEILHQMALGHNVVFFANHQTEPDPQAISLLLEKTHAKFAEDMIFVAGHRVVSDPLAVPFSLGRNLLCIYSKKHMESPPEQKAEKQQHNQRAMQKLRQLLTEGGKCIYVAPSGGRDRPDSSGKMVLDAFDPQSIEFFWLLSQQAGTVTHFYPLALKTHELIPAPSSVEKELGERRHAKCTPIHMAFGKEIDMENIPGAELLAKSERRLARALYIWQQVFEEYQRFN